MATDGQEPELVGADEPAMIVEEIFEAPEPIPEPLSTSAPRIRWKLGLVLFVLSLVGTVAVLPYSFTLLRQAKNSGIQPGMEPVIAVVSLFVEGILSAVAIVAGIGLGSRSGLRPFLLAGFDDEPEMTAPADDAIGNSRVRAWKAIGLASAIGIVLGAVVVGTSLGLQSSMPKADAQIENPPPLEGFFASIGAGIREEVWLRLGVMTLLTWLGLVISRLKPGNPAVIWTANVLAALAFGAIHLPQAAMLIGLNAAIVAFVFIGNGIPGIAFGWLFWRKGLVAAMVAHFVMDVVLKVVLPILGG